MTPCYITDSFIAVQCCNYFWAQTHEEQNFKWFPHIRGSWTVKYRKWQIRTFLLEIRYESKMIRVSVNMLSYRECRAHVLYFCWLLFALTLQYPFIYIRYCSCFYPILKKRFWRMYMFQKMHLFRHCLLWNPAVWAFNQGHFGNAFSVYYYHCFVVVFKPSLWLLFGFHGFVRWRVTYTKMGKVRMCF